MKKVAKTVKSMVDRRVISKVDPTEILMVGRLGLRKVYY